MVTLGVALVTTFQLASTALTTTALSKAVPAVCAVGAPVLPSAVPGAVDSPGNKICSLVTAPALTVRDGLVDCWIDGVVISLAVTVVLPAVLSVTLKIFV